MFQHFWGSTRAVHRLSDTICIENGTIHCGGSKAARPELQQVAWAIAQSLHKEQLRPGIDRALAQKRQLEDNCRLLEQTAYRSLGGKTISIGAEGWGNNNVRFDRLGDGTR